ncbi:SLC13 family permease [Nafulsella turpanensis]|uniref:SLC13 family permease n=1 Tax=Nafulsella turpanensis TaxID=1265690 RepID=UPI0003717D50|nr:SLC13 family permease [Nafulsella turpanensis]
MGLEAIVVLLILCVAVVLFITEWMPVDLVAILIMVSLVLTGVVSPEEGVAGFSNSATLTVAFMFVLSAALLKTGALQQVGPRLARVFQKSYRGGLILMMLSVALISAFINNTPVVAIFIPIIMQVAQRAGQSPSKLLIPLSYASIFGGTCTLIGTSTNILVSGIAEESGLEPFSMFTLTPVALLLLVGGIVYMMLIGNRMLPDRKQDTDLESKFGVRDYLAEIELNENADSVEKKIMDAPLVRQLDLEIMEVRRINGNRHYLPPGDLVLQAGDVLKVRCNMEKMVSLKEQERLNSAGSIRINNNSFNDKNTSLVELIITSNSEFEGKTLKRLDFRRKYRAVPLAIKHRQEIMHEKLQDVPLQAGDVILAEVKAHYLDKLKEMEREQESPFIVLSEAGMTEFNRRKFYTVAAIGTAVILAATFELVPIMMGVIAGAALLVLTRCISMKEFYDAIEWKVVFLLAGALSLGVAMQNSGLAAFIAGGLVDALGPWGPVAIMSGLYLMTSLFTEIMSNNATAALITPIAIATAAGLGINPLPFLLAVTFAASASFMTPVGYQTNTMIYTAGQYRFSDFLKVGTMLNLFFWLLATLLIPLFYSF